MWGLTVVGKYILQMGMRVGIPVCKVVLFLCVLHIVNEFQHVALSALAHGNPGVLDGRAHPLPLCAVIGDEYLHAGHVEGCGLVEVHHSQLDFDSPSGSQAEVEPLGATLGVGVILHVELVGGSGLLGASVRVEQVA